MGYYASGTGSLQLRDDLGEDVDVDLALDKLDRDAWTIDDVFNEDISLSFSGKWILSLALEELAPLVPIVAPGQYLQFNGEDDSVWRLVFTGTDITRTDGEFPEPWSKKFPLPGDRLLNRTVVASCHYIDDDDREPEALVLLLNPQEPYFTVAHVQYKLDPPVIVTSNDHHNIVDAVQLGVTGYIDMGGDV